MSSKTSNRITTPAKFIKDRNEELYTPARIVGDSFLRLHNGSWVTQKEFEKICPVPIVEDFSRSKENPDQQFV